MRVGGVPQRTIWLGKDGWSVEVIDQRRLPHEFRVERLVDLGGACRAIRDMCVRGAPLIGVTAAYGLALSVRQDPSDAALERALAELLETRPTAINLSWALKQMQGALFAVLPAARSEVAYARAAALANEDVAVCRAIGQHGLELVRDVWQRVRQQRPVSILTHCNAGWLAAVDFGTALAPIYAAHDAGIPVFVWVAETRPRNQGLLSAWELENHGVPFALVVDNAGGHLMQRGLVDLCITGTDRTTASGDVCNKIGTYLKALAARDNDVPFYVACPYSSIDWTVTDGRAIPIEVRAPAEVTHVTGLDEDGTLRSVAVAPERTPIRNDAFDVTPARLVTGIITEFGICPANQAGLSRLPRSDERIP